MDRYYSTSDECPKTIRDQLSAIEEAAGDALCSDSKPCGLVVTYHPGEPLPWRIADDWADMTFATAEEAASAAEDWYDE